MQVMLFFVFDPRRRVATRQGKGTGLVQLRPGTPAPRRVARRVANAIVASETDPGPPRSSSLQAEPTQDHPSFPRAAPRCRYAYLVKVQLDLHTRTHTHNRSCPLAS